MEYSKVQSLPHDPAMDPVETIPSYASSGDHSVRHKSMHEMSGHGADSSDEDL